MNVSSETLDGLLRIVFEKLLAEPKTHAAHKGEFKEVIGASLHLSNPLARLSRSEGKGKVFSALGEFLWYLSQDTLLEFINYYVADLSEESDDGIRVRGGYGNRLFAWRQNINQVDNVIQILRKSPTSRRAVIQLFDAEDIAQRYASAPCTCTLQFLGRDGKLHMFVAMRSNDAYLGLPHDVFAFTMLQELIARSVNLELGEYKHCAGSLHLYSKHFSDARNYLDEGWQDQVLMPPMPAGDPWPGVAWLRDIEVNIRTKSTPGVDLEAAMMDSYWKDLARLLLAFKASRDQDLATLTGLKDLMASQAYRSFVLARIDLTQDRRRENGSIK